MRLIKHERDHPFSVKLGDIPGIKEKISPDLANVELHICACGLSKHKPFCDGSHRLVQGEENGKLYGYKGNERVEITKETFELLSQLPNEYE